MKTVIWDDDNAELDPMDQAIADHVRKLIKVGMVDESVPECADEYAFEGWDITVDLVFKDGEIVGIMIDKIKLD